MRPSRRRILFFIPSVSGGGAERVFSTLIAHLDRDRFEIHLALLQSPVQAAPEIPPDVLVYDLKNTRVRYAIPALVKLVWKIRPDALLSTLGHLNLALIASRPLLPRGTKVLIRESTVASVFLRSGIPHPRVWQWLYRRLYRRADCVVCPSATILEDLAKNFDVPREKLLCIYNPLDFEKVHSLAESSGNPYSGRGPHLITAGHLSAEKGLDVLIDAMPTILQSCPDARLHVLGEGPLLPDLLEQAKRLGLEERIYFLGFQKNPWQYMRYADIFVLPSRFEGLPNALLEALALGTRAVASDCAGSVREILDYDDTITLVPPESTRELAKAIIAAAQFPRTPPAQFAEMKRRLRRFDLQQVVEEYSQILLSDSLTL